MQTFLAYLEVQSWQSLQYLHKESMEVDVGQN